MAKHNDIRKHWNDLATINGQSYKASWDDYYMLHKEILEAGKYIDCTGELCDIGCNNGYCDFEFLRMFPELRIVGVDYSDEAVAQACAGSASLEYKDRVSFVVGDILDPASLPAKQFDTVLIKRTLINLNTDKNQIQGLCNAQALIKPGGKIVLMEAVEENWKRLNSLRGEFGLPELKQPWHNVYLSAAVVDAIYANFVVDVDEDYSSSYYILSRVFQPWMDKIGNQAVSYLSELNRLAAMLPNIGDYGTQRIFVLSNKVK